MVDRGRARVRRWLARGGARLGAIGGTVLLVGTMLSPSAGAARCTLDDRLVPSCGVLWGMYMPAWTDSLTNVEEAMGRRFDIVKRYHDFSNRGSAGRFPNEYERRLGASGERILFFGWTSQLYGGGRVRWSAIAAGQYDNSVIEPVARRIKQWGKPVFIDFDHEPDAEKREGQGTPADYVAAYRHIRHVFDRVGVANAVWAWVTTGWIGNAADIRAMYPGDDYVDWIGWDPYNYFRCRDIDWRTPRETVGRWYDWLERNGFGNKPYLLAEYGTLGHPGKADAKADWYRRLPDGLAQYPRIKAVVQFNSYKTCDFRIHTSDRVLQAFDSAATDPYVDTGR